MKTTFRFVFVVICMFTTVILLHGQQIQTNGQYGGNVPSLAVSRTSLFTGTDSRGVWRRPSPKISYLLADPGWTVQNSGTITGFSSMKAVNQSIAWAAGDSGRVFMTTNGGKNWNSVGGGSIGLGEIFDIEALDSNTAFVAAYASNTNTTFIYRTTNGGATWEQVFHQSPGFIDAIKMYDANNGIAIGDPVGGKWTVLKTADGGASWGHIANEPAQVGGEYGLNRSLAAVGVSNIWFGSSAWRMHHSTDAGITWQSSKFPIQNSSAVVFKDSLNGIAGGDSGIVQTADGGNLWSSVKKVGSGWVGRISILGSDLFCVAGLTVYRSTDNGATWASSYSGPKALWDAGFVAHDDSISGWTVGENGIIAAFSGTRTPVGVENDRTSTPSDFALHQNFPNPFNPVTTIQYEIPKANHVILKVFDVLGREVATLVDRKMQIGIHNVQWDASRLSSGVYFYRLQAGLFAETKKLLLLR